MTKRVKDFKFDNRTKTVHFTEEERERLAYVMAAVRRRTAFVDPSKLIKELMGLTNVMGLTDEERQIVAGTKKLPKGARAIDVNSEPRDNAASRKNRG